MNLNLEKGFRCYSLHPFLRLSVMCGKARTYLSYTWSMLVAIVVCSSFV